MKVLIILFGLLVIIPRINAQPDAPLPDKLKNLPEELLLNHFPVHVPPVTDPDRSDFTYFWKHNTAVLSPDENVEVIECGAYLFYNNQWNLRIAYPPEDFEAFFNCPNGLLKKGQPYTFADNWRTGNQAYGGWALWYVIAKTGSGKKVFGAAAVETMGEGEK